MDGCQSPHGQDYSALTVYNGNTQNEVLNIGKTPDDPIQIEPWRA